ncbi:MAG: hypothetical protein IPN79_00115 [Saprospiraceae bacterium]|nr:hypothetical protein [Saprospiraceae bacterium]
MFIIPRHLPDKNSTTVSVKPKTTDPNGFVNGVDYYIEDGKYVFTEYFLKNRGYCCQSGCRHCPYGYKKENHVAG